jgi:DDE_Tnp_1-associated/Transposase DDE domain
MPVSHAYAMVLTSTGEHVPGLLEVLAQVADPRKRRGRRFGRVFVLAVAVCCVLAGARSFREIGDQAADLPQELLARLGGRPHPLWRRIVVPSEKRIRTLLQALDVERLDEITGGWLRALASARRLDRLLKAIAMDGKWLRGIGDGQQVKLFAAMLHHEKVVIAQHQIPEDTNEITQVRQLLDPVDLDGAVVTGDAAHAQRDTAEYIAGSKDEGNRGSDYLLFVKGNQPSLQRAIYDAIQHDCPREPDHAELDYGHGRIRRSTWVTDAAGLDFPHAAQVMRIRRDGYDATGTLVSKEIVHAVTSLDPDRADPACLARIARGQWGIESAHWLRDTAYGEDSDTGYTGQRPPGHGHPQEHRHQPAPPRRDHRDHPHPPGHHPRPRAHAQLPAAVRCRSQTTFPPAVSGPDDTGQGRE